MSLAVGFDAQTPSLPNGGGAVHGLGETFTPDLSTGTGTYVIPLDSPNGPNDIGPRLALRYDTGTGNGPFGMGFSLPLPRILVSLARGYPRYDGTDSLVLEGAGELLALGGGAYRPQVDGGAWRAQGLGDGFRLTDREGLHYLVGADAPSRLDAPGAGGASRVYAWHLSRIEDALGNAVTFEWRRDANQLYLAKVSYGAYELRFHYEPRPDPVHWARAGFLVTTALRCDLIELLLTDGGDSLLRRWTLSYVQAAANGASLLAGVTLSGFDAEGGRLDAPPLRLGYTTFAPRDLTRFRGQDDAAPGPLRRTDSRVELVDWDGDGLPDLLEVRAGGRARLWPNTGDCRWGRPRAVADLPLFASPFAAVGFLDLDGDGRADLVRTDRPLDGYTPRGPDGNFGRPVTWRTAPSARLDSRAVRLIDLDGDGRIDLMQSNGRSLLLYERTSDPDGWSPSPRVVPPGEAPTVDLADRHVFLADMTGDGSSDVVRVDGGGVTYWPHLGGGRWGEPVTMRRPDGLPTDLEPERLHLTDLDGDGLADLLYVQGGRARYWINQSGAGFSPERSVAYIPTGGVDNLRLADMRGGGVAGLLWSSPGPFGHGTEYFYLDFLGGAKPYLLNRIDNGIGLVTEVEYTTSARQAARAAGEGAPWATRLPVVVPVVERVVATDAATGRSEAVVYRYRDGRYDGVLREFAGFGQVLEDYVGDETAPTLRTTTWFHVGLHPETFAAPSTPDERRRLRAVRGRILRRERSSPDGSPLADLPFDRFEQTWGVVSEPTPGGVVHVPRLLSTVETTLERAATPSAVIATTNLAWDAAGNVIDTVQTSSRPLEPAGMTTLRTRNAFATDPAGRFLSRPWRTQQLDGNGGLIADTITEYDRAPEGAVGAQGLVTRRSALALSDALVADVYAAAPPDLAALGYFRRADSAGWWVALSTYERIEDAAGLRGRVVGPRGAAMSLEFDPLRVFPARITDPHGNTVTVTYDPRLARPTRLTDASGASHEASYDALARLVRTVDPGDAPALPTIAVAYSAGNLPVEVAKQRRADVGGAATIATRDRFDGGGRILERRIRDEAGEVILSSVVYNARGLPARMHAESRAAGPAYVPPAVTTPHAAFVYDALGRPLRVVNADGSFRSWSYAAGMIEEADEEDNRTGPDAPHAGTLTRRLLDPNGRIRAIEQRLGANIVVSSYEYDVKGQLTRHVDALGNEVRTTHDFLGRPIRVARPEQTTVSALDASGNVVEVRTAGGTTVFREFDAANRPVAERFGAVANPPSTRYVYHDAGLLAPPEAGAHTLGRLVRIDDEAGSTALDYDARGQVTRKRWSPKGDATVHQLDLEYRGDGQVVRVVFPESGGTRASLTRAYNARGLLSGIAGVVEAIEYDLAGRPTRLRYANGVEETSTYDIRGRLSSTLLTGPAGVLRSTRFRLDGVGNLLGIESPDPKLATSYVYDDFYRLVAAAQGSGESWSYRYDNAGNLTFKSDVGDYRYGEAGAPATCLTTAGTGKYTYTAAGDMASAPWGAQTFDPLGRLTRVVGPGGVGQLDFLYNHAGSRVVARSSGAAAPAVDLVTPDPYYSLEAGHLVLNLDGYARRRDDGAQLTLHRDHLGGLVLVTDAAGALVESVRYDPYGATLERTAGSGRTPIGFTGGAPDDWSGLLYLQARYYHPRLGRFISSDAIVQDVYDPIAWASYTYCRGNPTSYADPSGREFWRVFLVIVAIVALAVLTVLTFGTSAPVAVGVIIGVVAGGVVGGVSAAKQKGDAGDIVTGILVGAAVGGWAAFASAGIGGLVTAKLGTGILGSAVAGGLGGSVNGAAMGFAAGFGGKEEISAILKQMLIGTVVGMVTGAALGALTGAVNSGEIEKPKNSLLEDEKKGLEKFGRSGAEQKPQANMSGRDPDAPAARSDPVSPSQALGRGGALLGKPALPHLEYLGGKLGALIPIQVAAADLTSGPASLFPDEIYRFLREHNIGF